MPKFLCFNKYNFCVRVRKMVKQAVANFDALEPLDFKVLSAIERGMYSRKYVPISIIAKNARISRDKIVNTLSRLNAFDFIHRRKGIELEYMLNFHGLAALALHALYLKGILKKISKFRFNVGKESEIYLGLDFNEKDVLIKSNVVGYTSFHHYRRKREFKGKSLVVAPLAMSIFNARKEASILNKLYDSDLPIPHLLGQNRHLLVLEYFEGEPLQNLDKINEPLNLLESLLDFIDVLFNEHGLVHGDFSAFNVLYSMKTGDFLVIDFPQAVSSTHPNYKNYLYNDLQNIIGYFENKFGIGFDVDQVFKKILLGKKT